MTRLSYAERDRRYAAAEAARKARQEIEWIAELDATENRYYGTCYFFAGDEGPIKIGYSRDPGRRLGEIALQAGYPLMILAVANGGYYRETYYHQKFAAHRLHGEWFERCPEILAEIAALNMRKAA